MSTATTFDESYYLSNNADVVLAISQGAFSSGLQHYQLHGGKSELRDPNATFDASYYAAQNSDVLSAVSQGLIANVFAHYQANGEAESRAPSASFAGFNATSYLAANTDVAAAITAGSFTSALDHYIQFGSSEARSGSGVTTTTTGSTFTLTSGTDTFTGTTSNDSFVSDLINESGVANVTTLNSTDTLDGGAGTDTLTATYDDAVSATISNIETLTLSGRGAVTFDFVNVSGVTDLNIQASTAAVDLNNIAAIPTTLDISNQSQNVDIDFAAAAVSGSSDTLTMSVASMTAGNIIVDTGIETVSLTSSGSAANTIADLQTTTGASTLNILGSQALTITAALDAAVTTVSAASATGDVAVTFDQTANVTVTGGAANDTITLGTTFTSADVVNGGAGTDKLSVGEDEAVAIVAANSNITNVEILDISEALGGGDNVNLTLFGASASAAPGTLELSAGLAGSSTLTIASGNTVDMEADVTTNLTLAIGGSGTSDTATLILDNADIGGTLVATTIETLNITSTGTADGGANVITGTTAINSLPGDQSIVITGAEALTFTAAVTADVINGSAMTDVLTVDAGTAGASTVTGGSAADNLDMDDGQTNIVSGGAGADAIDFDIEVADNITGGAGNDTFLMGNDTDVTFVISTITDLETGDDLDLDISTLEANTLGGAAITDLQSGNGTTVVAGDATIATVTADNQALTSGDIVLLSGKTYANAAAALTDIGAAGDRTFTTGAAFGDNEGLVLAYELASGGVELAVVSQNGGVNTSSTMDAIDAFLNLTGVTAANFSTFDIDYVA